jgi:ABC-type uncharacterized transport system permease subunit
MQRAEKDVLVVGTYSITTLVWVVLTAMQVLRGHTGLALLNLGFTICYGCAAYIYWRRWRE